jgi:hypothetical protein
VRERERERERERTVERCVDMRRPIAYSESERGGRYRNFVTIPRIHRISAHPFDLSLYTVNTSVRLFHPGWFLHS